MDLPFERVVYESSAEDFETHSAEVYPSADDLSALAHYHLVSGGRGGGGGGRKGKMKKWENKI